MKLRLIKDVKDLKNKKVLYRVDYNFTLTKKGNGWVAPEHHRRFTETLPTIKFLLKHGCSIVFLSWLKRPDGKVVEEYKMDPVARRLANLIGRPVTKLDDCVGEEVETEINNLKPKDILMLENVRFHQEEMDNDMKFAKNLTKGLDLIVFDAFAQSHRVHSSTVGIMKYLPSYSGLLLEKELNNLEQITKNPKKPLTIILGGAKISDKINVLKSLIKKADNVLIGGGLANIFFKSKGIEVESSYVEDVSVSSSKNKGGSGDLVKEINKLLKNKKIILPIDLIATDKINSKSKTKVVNLSNNEQIPKNWQFVDIGPKTIKMYEKVINESKTVLWNGPMGVFEINKFGTGTKEIANTIAKSKVVSIIGGGDTELIIKKYNLKGKFSHVSTGGGAMLEFLEGKILPGVKPLMEK